MFGFKLPPNEVIKRELLFIVPGEGYDFVAVSRGSKSVI